MKTSIGGQETGGRTPLRYNFDITGGGLGANWQLGSSRWYVGVGSR